MTEFNIGKTYHGFTLKRKEYIKEIDSTVYLFTHDLLGTPSFAIKNSDPNKTFCIGFQTIPHDSTGVAHILEHSVLMGSKKYPVKDVFGEINKGGLMTFLNAMTGSDTTWYPFATRNEQEYFNIMDVYCDVTLNPLLEKSTFDQEGWHYHLENIDQPLQYQGVVYNEMKGAFSDPFRHIFHNIFKGLMPGSTYAHESGGDPECIPELDYETFVNFHKKHYHPSNSMLFFYGNADLDEELAFVEDNFFSEYKKAGEKITIEPGTPIREPVFIEETYGVQPGSNTDGKTFLAVGSLTGDVNNRKLNTALQVIANILFNSDASPLKNKIIESGLCHDFGGFFISGSSSKSFMLAYLIGCDPDKQGKFLDIYKQALTNMVENSLDPELVLSELNKYEFSVREELNKPQRGLEMISKALTAIKYGTDPFAALKIEQLFSEIRREAMENGFFEQVIREQLLDNRATAIVTLKPDPDKMAKSQEKENKRLGEYADNLGEQGLEKLVENTTRMIKRQAESNDEETLALLPSLDIKDLNCKLPFFQADTEVIDGQKLIVSELDTNGISYIDIGFNCSGLSLELLSILDIFGTIVTEIGTDELDFQDFAKQINIYTGGFSHSFSTYPQKTDPENVQPVLWLQFKVLSGYLEQALDLVRKVICAVNLDDRQRIRDIVQREFAWAEHNVQSEGYSLASTRVSAQLGLSGKYNERVNGATAYLNLKELAENYERHEEQFINSLKQLKKQLLSQKAITAGITGRNRDILVFKQQLQTLFQSLPKEGEQPQVNLKFPELPGKTAFSTSAEVVFNVQGCHLFEANTYTGHFEVMKTWLSRDYLWNTVRQLGGAYGCFVQFNQLTGNMIIVSYRDPRIKKTFATYNNAWKQVENIELTEGVLNQLIIGTYGNFDPHQGPAGKGATARNEQLAGITAEFKQRRIEEILNCQVSHLRSFGPYLKKLSENPFIATIGNSVKIEENKELYDEIISL